VAPSGTIGFTFFVKMRGKSILLLMKDVEIPASMFKHSYKMVSDPIVDP
jgi:hypothetical protein